MAEILTFKPKITTKRLIGTLPEKGQDVLKKRFGLEGNEGRMTLESIGNSYGITRERVRQIENFAIQSIRKSSAFEECSPVFSELARHMREFGGGVVHEDHFLDYVAPDDMTRNHVRFFLVLGDGFERLKEDDRFHERWTTDRARADQVAQALVTLVESFGDSDLLQEEEVVDRFAKHLTRETEGETVSDRSVLMRWLAHTKDIAQNPLGDWGLASSPNIKVRGMRDLAFLVLRRYGKPLHFSDVAREISARFNRPAHVATCHNELIKDRRFVLVGRGLYALTEWGYRRGTVRDIISSILEKEGPLVKADIVSRVTKERLVKESTIAVNLQNGTFFRRDPQGRYTVSSRQ